MKVSKTKLTISFVISIVLIVLVGRFAYSIGQHNASLTVKEATPKQLAEAMQNDNFYGEYPSTMLLVNGKVQSLTNQGGNTLVQFETTNSSSALGKVTCNLVNTQATVKVGDSIHILSVANDAERRNTADVFMQNCYLLKQ